MTDDDYPGALTKEAIDGIVSLVERVWGTEEIADFIDPGMAKNKDFRRWIAKSERVTARPREAAAYLRIVQTTDVRTALASIRVPTLLIHRDNDPWISLEQGRYLAEHIEGARLVTVTDEIPFAEATQARVEAIQEFLTGVRVPAPPDRVLASILLVDIVGSTERAAETW
jgi:pimeloyl-ACP methyl ester carboxylesterase